MSATLLDAHGVTRHLGTRTVLDGVDLRVGAASRVALAGPNGAGKSTLLRILAGELAPDAGTVVAHGTVGLLPQLAGTPTDAPARTVVLERLGVAAASRTLDAAEARLAAAATAHENRAPAAAGDTAAAPTDPEAAHAVTEAADPVAAHAAALDRWLALGGADAEARIDAAADAAGLGLGTLARPLRTLSGGEAARVGLVAVEAARWDVLLLDEPTQHLDAAGLERLATLLRSRAGYVLVSHDRALLERATTEVVALDPHTGAATHHGGGWASFEAAAAAERHRAQRAYDEAVTKRAQLGDAAEEALRRAARTTSRLAHTPRDNDKARREWFAARADGVRRRAKTIAARADRDPLPDKPTAAPTLRLDLGASERGQEWVLALEGAVLRRGEFTLGPLDLALRRGERVRLAGPNGSGKSTVLAALAGRLEPTAGVRRAAATTVVGELGQDRVAPTASAPTLDGAAARGRPGAAHLGVAAALVAAAGVTEPEARSALAQMGLGAEIVERPAHTLSPGERTRAELARLALARTTVLLLDEPTTHLDVEALELLEAALAGWPGALVVATHDVRLTAGLRLTRTVSV